MPLSRTEDFPPSTLTTQHRANARPHSHPGRSRGGRSQPPRPLPPGDRNARHPVAHLDPLQRPTLSPLGAPGRKRTTWEESKQSDRATNSTDTIDLTQEQGDDKEAELEMTLPSKRIIEREQHLRKNPPRKLSWDDFYIEDSSDGTSLLLSRLIEEISSIHTDLTPFQTARLAAHATVHHPLRLLEYLRNTSALNTFVIESLSTHPIDPTEPYYLCPLLTPYLVPDDTLRNKMGDYKSLTDEDSRDILGYYVDCFYPANYREMMAHIQGLSSLELEMMICDKGALTTEFDKIATMAPNFTPPEWIDLTAIIIHDHPETTHLSSTPTFDPFHHIGIPRNTFLSMPPEEQKQTAMARLPHALVSITTMDTILSILTTLRDTPATKMADFLSSDNLANLLQPKRTTQTLYRYRIQKIRGKTNALWKSGPGALLSHWLQLSLPLILPKYSFTLLKSPHPNDQDAIPFHSAKTIPEANSLATYTTDTHTERSTDQLTQFDFWFSTSCSDISPIIPKPSHKTTDYAHQTYLANLSRVAIRATRLEFFPANMDLCAVMIGSTSRDFDSRIKTELVERLGPQYDPSSTTISWMSIRTRLDRYSTMAQCILAPPEHATDIRELVTRATPPLPHHYVTHTYSIVAIPPVHDPSYDTVMAQTITSQVSNLESTTSVSFVNLNSCDPFTLIPPLALMAGTDPTITNQETMASLITTGKISLPDGSTLSSPVTKIATDMAGTRLFLFAPKSQADTLITFAGQILTLMPTWTNQTDKIIQLDPSEARRSLRETHQITGPSQVTIIQPTRVIPHTLPPPVLPPTLPTFPPPPPHPFDSKPPSTMVLSTSQYNTLLTNFTTLFERLDKNDTAIDKLTSLVSTSTSILTHADWSNDIISAVTTTLSSEAGSIRQQQTSSLESQSSFHAKTDSHLQLLSHQCENLLKGLQPTLRNEVTTQTDDTTISHTPTGTPPHQSLQDTAPIAHAKVSSVPHSSLTSTHPTENDTSSPDGPLLSVVYSPDERLHHTSTKGECTACHVYSDDLKICYDCELPFDYQCILAITNKLTHEADYQCINCHRASASTHISQPDDLTEPSPSQSHADNSAASHTDGSDQDADSATSSSLSQQSHTTHSKPSSDPTSRTPKQINIRLSPRKTRSYMKDKDPDPPDPHHA